MKLNRYIRCLMLLLISILLVGCNNKKLQGSITDVLKSDEERIKIHYIDVGQGDSTFIELPNNETMLIDAGEAEYEEVVTNYIKKLGYTKITYLVGTHPHSDHIGGLEKQVETFQIGKIYMPKAVSTTKTYTSLLETIKNKNYKVQTAKEGVNILNNNDLKIDILSPKEEEYSNLNNYSVVIKITYKERSFLFMGDAEELIEEELTSDIKADVIKVGHHGSDTSSSNNFVKKVNPTYAIISVGKANKYNHPASSVLDRWKNIGAKIYRTDEEGTIILISDGEGIQIQNSKETIETNNSISKEEIKDNEEIKLVSLTEPIERGKNATITIEGKANTTYSIKVMYKSGASSASGLENKTSDNNGKVSWTWKVASNVTPGTYEIIISNENTSKTISYKISE